MYGIDDPSSVAAMPAPEAANTAGFFTEGNPATGVPATLVRASFLNGLQQEMLNILAAANLTPAKTTYNQVLTAIQTLISQAQGNFEGFAAYSSAQTITVAQAGWLIGFASTTGAATYTLPSPAGRAALTYTFTNYSSYPLTLSTPAGAFARGGGTANFVVPGGTGVVIASDGVNWQVLHGDAALQNSPLLAASKTSSGYQKLPSGLVIQWGLSSAGSTSAGAVVNFPIAFPNTCFSVTGSDAGSAIYSYGVDTITAASFKLYGGFNNNGTVSYQTGACRWIAVGY